MTAQISDKLRYGHKEFSLVGVRGSGLFSPKEHGMEPHGSSSACWRGYVCRYGVTRDTLLLKALYINLRRTFGLVKPKGKVMDEASPPLLNGVSRTRPDSDDFDSHYRNVNLPIPFTGGLLIARDFVRELYVHMGFHPAWKYREVHELLFE